MSDPYGLTLTSGDWQMTVVATDNYIPLNVVTVVICQQLQLPPVGYESSNFLTAQFASGIKLLTILFLTFQLNPLKSQSKTVYTILRVDRYVSFT